MLLVAITLQDWRGKYVADIYTITAQCGQHVASACNIKGKKICYVVHAHNILSSYHM